MRNLFKKSLTLCLVAILAFSCFAGIVSAENTFAATIAVDNQTITPGTTSVDVVLNITSSQIGINEALIEVSSDIGTINSKATLDEATAAIASIELPEGSTNYGSFYLSAKNDISGETGETTVLGSIATASITVTFTVDENKAVGTYPINIKVDGVRAASGNEDVISFNYVTANVTVEEKNVEPETFTVTFVDSDGTTVLKTEEVAPNGAATAPEVADDLANDTYFIGWDVDFSNITTDTTVTAQYVTLAFRIRTRYLKLQDAIRYCVTIQTDKGSFIDESVSEFGILVWNEGEAEYSLDTATVIARDEDTYYDASTDRYEMCIDKTSKQMSDGFSVRVYAKLKNGTIVYGKKDGEYQYHNASIKDYSESQINNANTAENMKKLITALLIYGSKAQIAFDYNTNNLADSGLTSEQKSAIEAEIAPWNAVSERLPADSNTTLDVDTVTTRIRTASLMLQSNTMINYGADLTGDAKASLISEVYILSWSEDDYNNIVATDVNGLVYGTATGCELAEVNTSNGRYYANSYPLKSKDLYDDVYTRAYIIYSDGTVGYTGVLKYSAEYYCQNYSKETSTHSDELKALYNATMVYGNYAIINFG